MTQGTGDWGDGGVWGVWGKDFFPILPHLPHLPMPNAQCPIPHTQFLRTIFS
ncbi:hypothetical protein H6G98_07020 [Nostoc sp. FACHB-857]|nr:hypothetical protein [Nostoc sp. FACHB-857]